MIKSLAGTSRSETVIMYIFHSNIKVFDRSTKTFLRQSLFDRSKLSCVFKEPSERTTPAKFTNYTAVLGRGDSSHPKVSLSNETSATGTLLIP